MGGGGGSGPFLVTPKQLEEGKMLTFFFSLFEILYRFWD